MAVTLTAERRDGSTSPRALRRAGKLPAVVYGPHQHATSISVEARAFDRAYGEAGESSIVSLEGLGAALATLVHEVDLDPVLHQPRHVDFYAVTRGEKVEVAVPLEFTGESPAVRAGANLVKILHELPVEADPMNLPHELTFDISMLSEVGAQVRAGDVRLPTGVTLAIDPDEVVALVQEVSEEPEEAAPADLASIEVEGKGKDEAPGEADAESA